MRLSKNRRRRIFAKNDANHFIELTVRVYVDIHFTGAKHVKAYIILLFLNSACRY